MIKYLKKEYIIAAFIAVMGFAAGVGMEGGGAEYLAASLDAAANIDGSALLWLALFGMLFDAVLYLFAAAVRQAQLSFAACGLSVWAKAFIMGYFCKTLLYLGPSVMTITIALFTLLGGGAVCLAIFMQRYGNGAKAVQRSISMLAAGVIIEGVMLPSALRTIALIVK